MDRDDDNDGGIPSPISAAKESALYETFKKNWLLVYCLVITSDWLQGPSTYPLYISYGYDLSQIAILFIVGFLSSALFGTIIGSFADKFGRKRLCLLFCIVYAASCFTKLSRNFAVLLLGRVLGGVSTSLLFSVFEAWMVSEHLSRGFHESLLSDTFSWSTWLNGLVAILSGLLANVLSARFGEVAPFMGAIVFLAIGFVVVYTTWKENYGGNGKGEPVQNERSAPQNGSSIWDSVLSIWNSPDILAVGVMQCCFESAMYTFVFLWQPVLEAAAKPDASSSKAIVLPYGLIFATFMVSIMLGSVIFKKLLTIGWKQEDISWVTFAVASGALFIPVLVKNEMALFWSFNLFELCCGLYFPSIGTLRSKLVPEDKRSTVMNVFRIPLNLMVVCALSNVKAINPTTLFLICSSSVFVSMCFSRSLKAREAKRAITGRKSSVRMKSEGQQRDGKPLWSSSEDSD
ncbi:hypothetical protein DFS34DRAFT_577782 [Phlyctochytrium arcticum]|nr:hypothetical protein DFS34DRAFT_577782 [Phlyctochytrium arcticum]